MNSEEWKRRYRQRLIDRAGISETMADLAVIAGEFGQYDFEDSPEAAADEEMSCWD